MSFSVYGTNKRDYDLMMESLTDKSLDGNFKTLKVMDANVITDVSGKLDSSAIGDKSLDGNFKTLKVMDADVQHQSSNIFIPIGTESYSVDTSQRVGVSGPDPSVYSFANINTGYITKPPPGDYDFLLDFQYGPSATGKLTIGSSSYSNVEVVNHNYAYFNSLTINGPSAQTLLISSNPSYESNPWTMTLTPASVLSTNGDVRVCGNMGSETLEVLGATSLEGTLNVTGLSTLSGGLSTSGTTTLNGGFSCSTSGCSIGNTISPTLLLHNSSSTSANSLMKFTMATSTSGSRVGIYSTRELVVENLDAAPLSLGTNGTRRLYISSAGNVGIGSFYPSSPSYLLDVNGTANASGLITANGGLTIGGSNNITLGNGTVTPSSGQIGYTVSATIPASTTANTAFASLSLDPGVWIVTYCIQATSTFTLTNVYITNDHTAVGPAYSCVGSYIASGTSTMTCDLKTTVGVTLQTGKTYHKAVRIA